jgi:hypothetical protein
VASVFDIGGKEGGFFVYIVLFWGIIVGALESASVEGIINYGFFEPRRPGAA